jgi:hypothetical protein
MWRRGRWFKRLSLPSKNRSAWHRQKRFTTLYPDFRNKIPEKSNKSGSTWKLRIGLDTYHFEDCRPSLIELYKIQNQILNFVLMIANNDQKVIKARWCRIITVEYLTRENECKITAKMHDFTIQELRQNGKQMKPRAFTEQMKKQIKSNILLIF